MMTDALRRLAWRMGRKIYCWARRELTNDPQRNGEYWLLRESLQIGSRKPVLMDVGANKGEWSFHALEASRVMGLEPVVHAFEPGSGTRGLLESRLAGRARIWPFALSSIEGEADFFSAEAGSGTSSLSQVSGREVERVTLTTVDAFLAREGITHVSMLKVDTEGFDFQVLLGAAGALADGRIDVIQFEYNWRWLQNHSSLLDVFGLIAGTDYRLGKLVEGAIILYEQWHFEMDRFFETNYVLVKKGGDLEKKVGVRVRFDASNVESRY